MNTKYQKDAVYNLYFRPEAEAFGYSEGQEAEGRLLRVIEGLGDCSTFSQGLVDSIDDWSTRYHFSRSRHCLLRPLGIGPGDRVLELGCGTGAITRYLGETGAQVTAVEGSLARARVAAARCHDLPNVQVIADDLQTVNVEGAYDWVTLIGVLEYAGAYSGAQDPYQAYLQSAIRHLRPGGRVVIAIENQLGLKYFNGCGEDHLGKPFAGVQDLYLPSGGVRTFGRKALGRVLAQAGLEQQQWLYPYPDYKVPNVVLTDAALAHPGFNAADLLLRNFSEDYSGNMLRVFDEALVNRVLEENGLLADLANSFLVVASAEASAMDESKAGAGATPWQPQALAWTFAVHRQPLWCTETRLEAGENSVVHVHKRALLPGPERWLPFVQGQTLGVALGDADYFPGWQQAWEVLRVHARQADVTSLVQALLPWARLLLEQAEEGVSPLLPLADDASKAVGREAEAGVSTAVDAPVTAVSTGVPSATAGRLLRLYCLPGNRLDHAPFNLMVGADDQCQLIDQEWVVSCPVPAGWVLTRGVLHTLQLGVVPEQPAIALVDVVVALAEACGFEASEQDVQAWFGLEAQFSRTLASRRDGHHLNGGTRMPFLLVNETVAQLRADFAGLQQKRAEEVARLQHELGGVRAQLADAQRHVSLRDQENIENLTRIDQYQTRIQALEQERDTLLASRSWRWSRWLREIRRRSRI